MSEDTEIESLRERIAVLEHALRERERVLRDVLIEHGRSQLHQVQRAAELAAQTAAARRLDPATNLLRHGEFRTRLAFEIARSDRTGQPLGLIIADIDRFHEFVDATGYEASDRALAFVGSSLESVWLMLPGHRPPAMGREGPDSFGIAVPDTSLEDLAERAEEVRNLIERVPVGPPRITASVGAALRPPRSGSVQAFLAAAYEAVTEASSNGGNTVVFRTTGDSPAGTD